MNAKQQTGFTLIELVVVIVILGILAATALPKFVDLKSNAQAAATAGVAGALSSAFAVNYGAYAAGGTAKGSQVTGNVTVTAIANNIMIGGIPTGYTVAPSVATCGTTVGATATVGVQDTGSVSPAVTATVICTG